MSDSGNVDLEKRLAALERGKGAGSPPAPRRSPLLALVVVLAIGAGGALLYLLAQPEEEEALPTATPDVFQNEGDGFGAIETLPPPEPEVVLVTPEPAEPNAELLAQLAALQAQIEELRNAPEPVVEEDTAAAEAIDALTAQIAALQAASEAAQQQFRDELTARDRELEQLRMDLELAQLEANRPLPAPIGPTEDELRAREEERLRREEEARRLAELERRAAEERAFQERRITSPTIAFGGTTGANETALTERTFGEVTDFVLNGALPTSVTQAEVIANPSNTIIQGTMIQAVMETALDSSLPGQTRAVVSEDVFSFDGSRLLIPRGSRLIGRYRSGVDIAQRRVTIAWDRIILPDNQNIQISSFGGDELGRSGVTGFVDTRFDERFGSAALISLISAAPSATAANVQDETAADVLEDVGDDLADATDSVIGDYLSIGPVIYVDQGARVTVMVDRDLEIFDAMSLSYLQTSLDRIDAAARDDVIEICINPDGSCWGEFQGDHFMRKLDQALTATEVKDLGNQIASSANTTMSKDRPIVSVSITYKGRPIRAQVITPPAVLTAMSISLRFFSSLPLDGIALDFLYGKERKLEELRLEKTQELREVVAAGVIDDALAFCVENKLNMIVSGGTSTGKTVAARKILSHVPSEERIVTIEEAAELLPTQPNAVTLIANRDAEFQTADVLLTATLRMRPDRIILGEVRGKEAMTFLEAINTGHGGSMTTLHAETPQLAVQRLAIAALKTEIPMTYTDMIQYIENSIDVIIQAGRHDGKRGITEFYLPGINEIGASQ